MKAYQNFMRRRKHEDRIDLADLESDTFSFRVPDHEKMENYMGYRQYTFEFYSKGLPQQGE